MGFTETISSIVEKVQQEVHGFYFQDERGPGTTSISIFNRTIIIREQIYYIIVALRNFILNPDRFMSRGTNGFLVLQSGWDCRQMIARLQPAKW